MIFSDSKSNQIYKSTNGFQDFKITQLKFKPETFYFTKDENILFASTTINNLLNVFFYYQIFYSISFILIRIIKFKFWISADFGNNWFMLQEGLTDLPKWYIIF